MASVSIIVPIYNMEKYLNRCIESIVNQTLKDIEIILVNDGSTDNSKKICEEWCNRDNRIILINKKNGGLSDARNKGIEMASSKFIGFVDSDDWIEKNMFKDLFTNIKKYNADICALKFEKVNKYSMDRLSLDNNIKVYSNIEALKKLFTVNSYTETALTIPVWNKLYNKKLFDKIRFPKGKLHEDVYVTYKLFYNSIKIVELNKIGYFYYQRLGSIINSDLNIKKLEVYDNVREIYKYICNKDIKLENLVLKQYVSKYLNLYNELNKSKSIDEDIKKIYRKRMINDFRSDLKGLIKNSDNIKLTLIIVLFSINPNIYNYYKCIQKKIRGIYTE